MSGGRTTAGGSNGRARRWWERALASVLILIAIVVAILLFLAIANWRSWYPEGTGVIPPDVPSRPIEIARRRLIEYAAPNEVFNLAGPEQHERYLWFQPKPDRLTYLFVAVQSAYGDVGGSPPPNLLQVCKSIPAPAYPSCAPIPCRGPFALSDTSSGNGSGSAPIWSYYCVVGGSQDQGGSFTMPWGAFRVLLDNRSSQQLRYTYVSNCDRRYPRGDACPEDDTRFPGPGYPPSAGYPSSSGYPSNPPGYSPPYPTYPTPPASSPPPRPPGNGG